MPIGIDDIAAAATAANAGSNLLNTVFGDDGIFGHSSWHKTLKVGEAQNQVNQQMALWNMENVTKPVFQMENAEWNRRFAEQNAEWERQWNMQNEYNTPEAQVQRMRAAGLNPAGMDMNGGGTAAPGAIGNPTVNEAASQLAQPANLFDARMAEAQAKLAEANAVGAINKARLTEREIQEKAINNKTLAELNAGYVKLQNSELETQKTNRKLTKTEIKKGKALIRQIDEDCKRIVEETNKIISEQKNVQEQWYEIRSRRFLNEAQENATDIHAKHENLQAAYQETVNKYADQQQQWVIKEIMSRFNLNQAEAESAFQMGKQIAQGIEIKDWKFGNLKTRWNEVGQWELSQDGARVQAKWKRTPLLLHMDEAQAQWDKDYQAYRAAIWYGEGLVDRMKRGAMYMGTYTEKPSTGNQPTTPSYLNNEYYNP